MRNVRSIVVFMALVIALAFASSCFALSINIDPSNAKLMIKPGDTKNGYVTVRNSGSSPIKIKAYVSDWVYAEDGSKTFIKPGSSVYSCSNWIKLDKVSFELSAAEERKVNYTITAPKNTSGGHVSVIFFEGVIGKTSEIAVSGRIGSIIYADTEGDVKRTGELGNISISGSREGDTIRIRVPFVNKGNTYVLSKERIIVTRDDKTVADPQIISVNALPNDTSFGSLSVPSLKEGNYKVKVECSYEDKTLKSESEFSIKK